MSIYDIVIFNKTVEGVSEQEAMARIKRLLRLSDTQAQDILARPRTVIKRDVGENQVAKYQTALEKCGLSFNIIPASSQQKLAEDLVSENSEPAPQAVPQTPEQNELALVDKEDEHIAASANNTISGADDDTPSPTAADVADVDVYQVPKSAESVKVFCRECGAVMGAKEAACRSCGAKAIFTNGRSKVVAGFLALFLGGFGIHRFYLRQWWGIFYIPLGLIGVSPIVTLIEAIYFWACSKEKWNEKYGHLPPANTALIVVIAILPFIAVLGILAAVAIPAYHDYTVRAKVASGLEELNQTSAHVSEFISRTHFVPESNVDAGMATLEPESPYLSAITIGEGGTITGDFVDLDVAGKDYSIILTPLVERDHQVSWGCRGGTLPDKYRPSQCRGGSSAQMARVSSDTLSKTLHSSETSVSIRVPSNWREGVAETTDASINAGNIYREAYVIVIEDALADLSGYDLESFAQDMTDYYLETLDDAQLLEYQDVTGGNVPGVRADVSATVDGMDVSYIIYFYFSQDTAYQVLTWSLASRMERNTEVLTDVGSSFTIVE